MPKAELLMSDVVKIMSKKRILSNSAAAAILLLGGLSLDSAQAQNNKEDYYKSGGGVSGKTVILPIGTSFEGRIQTTIGSRDSRQGERFAIEVSAPVMANGSEVLIPSGAQVLGEVVEAIPSSRQQKEKNYRLHPLGKLRTQLMSLQMPDGQTYPLVASISGDATPQRVGMYGGMNAPRKSGVAYVGNQAGFDAVNPALQQRGQMRNGKLAVMRKDEFLRDSILGDDTIAGAGSNKVVRSLVKKGRDLYIYSGSPITIKLDAPLKLAVGGSAGRASINLTAEDDDPLGKNAPKTGRRFAPVRPNKPEEQPEQTGQQGAPQQGQQPANNSAPPANNGNTNRGGQAPGSDF